MSKTTTYKGYKTLVGVAWSVCDTDQTITIKCYPKQLRGRAKKYQLYKTTWSRTCPTCKTKNILQGFGQGKGEFGVEGGVKCPKCDADFCGVSGYDTISSKSTRQLKLVNNKNSCSNTSSSSSTSDKKQKINEAKIKFKEDSKPKESFSISVEPNPLLKPCSYVYINIENGGVIPSYPYFIQTVDISDDSDASLTLSNYVPTPDSAYSPPSSTSSSGSGENKSTSKASDSVQQELMDKGASLGSFSKIKSYIRKNGTLGMKYDFYYNHIKGEDPFKWGKASAQYCMKVKRFNCVDSSWIFWAMCKGAGIKINIISGNVTVSSGATYGHFWNEYNGKRHDISVTTGRKYVKKKTVI